MQNQTYHFEIVPEDKGKRLDKFLVENLSNEFSRVFLQRLVTGGHIRVNGLNAKPNHRILPGESIDVVIPPAAK